MSMTYLFFDATSWVIVFVLIGYPLTKLSRAVEGAERLPWALILGICAMIIYVRTINAVAGVGAAMPFIVASLVVWLGYHWRKRALRKLLAVDLCAVRPLMGLCWLAALIALIIVLNIPVLKHGASMFEYSLNHDAIYYVTNARWMLGHRFGEVVTYSADKPLFSMVTPAFGGAPPLGRVGAEGLLAFVSAVTGQDPTAHFQALQTVATIAAVAISALLLSRRARWLITRPTAAGPLAITCLVFAPALIQIPIYSSYSNAFGVVLMTAFVLVSLRSPSRRLDILQILLFAGLLATYPEMSPISFVVIGGVMMFELIYGTRTVREQVARGVQLLAVIGITLIVLPWISIAALRVLKTVYFVASTQGASWPDPYAGLSRLQLVVATLTTSRSLGAMLPGALIVVVGTLLCVIFVRSLRRSRDSAFYCGVLLAMCVFVSYVYFKEFNYGKLKILEYFSPFIAPCFIMGFGFTIERATRSAVDKLLSYAALLIITSTSVVASAVALREGIRISDNKYIANDFVDAVSAANALPDNGFLGVKFLDQPFFYSMWVSYFSKESVVFSRHFGSGGYLEQFVGAHPAASYQAASEIIADRAFFSTVVGAKVLAQYGRFVLYDPKGSIQVTEGLYAKEGNWSWMGKRLVLDISGNDARFINFVLSNRFAPEANVEKIQISIDRVRCETLASTKLDELSVPLPDGGHHTVTIAPAGRAVSPSMLGQSIDSRILTYQVSGLTLSSLPAFELVRCAR